MHLNNGLDIPPRNRDILETSIQEILRTYNASMWLAGPDNGEGNYVDSLGFVPAATANSLVGYADDAGVMGRAENWIINSEFVGADAVTPPSIWTGFTTTLGVVFSYVGGGEDEFGRYIDIRVLGTASGSAFPVLHAVPIFSTIAIKPGEIMSVGGFHQIIAGSTAGITVICPRVQALTGAGGYVEEIAAIPILPTSERTYASGSRVVVGATAVYARPCYQFNVLSGATVDCTVRIWNIQANRGRLNPYTPTFGTMITKPTDTVPAYQATTGFKPLLAGGMSNGLINSRTLSSWSQTGPGTVTLNAAKALDGSMAATVVKRTGPAALFFSRSRARPGTAALSFSGAVVAKPGIDGRFITVRLQGVYPAYSDVMFDMHSGTVVYTKVNGGMTLTKYDIKALKDGYWLCRMVTADPGGVSAVLSFTTKETRSDLDTAASAGDESDVIIDNTALGFSSDFFEYPFPVNAAVVQETNQAPYSWKFDGVDDRLSLAKPTVDPNGDHFFIVCFKMPPTPIGIATWVTGAGNAGVSERAGLVFLGNSQLVAFWRDTGAVNTSALTMGTSRAVNEKVVATARRSGANFHGSVRGNVVASNTQTLAVVMNAWTATMQVIGAGISTGSVDFFSSSEFYGVISGNGNPTAGEITAMENFLAGHAGFTPLP